VRVGPIGVFDSGIGGLTVVAALRRALPHEQLIYLGDTARVPYGTKSPDVVRRYTERCARFLIEQGAKLLVVACNTASAHGLHALEGQATPVVGVVRPGAMLAASRSKTRRIGVIGTEGTVQSKSYQAAIHQALPDAQVFAAACPMFVPLAEEGLGEHPATRLLAEDYLRPLVAHDIDTLVLGCTHYPLLKRIIHDVVGPGVDVIDSAEAVADAVREKLHEHGLASQSRLGVDRFYATDVAERFARVGRAFLGEAIGEVELVDL
jgi:glutamate racemase